MAKQHRPAPKRPGTATNPAYEDHEIPGTGVIMQRRVQRHAFAPESRPFIYPKEQVEDLAAALKLGMNVMLTGPTGCIAGEAQIGVNRAGKSFQLPLSEVVRRFNGGAASGHSWDLSIPTRIRTRGKHGRVRLADLRAAMSSGFKPVYRVRMEKHTVRATADHEFHTASGWKRLDELVIGERIYVEGVRAPADQSEWKKNWYVLVNGLKLHPYAARRGVQSGKGGWSVVKHRLVMEAALNGMPYEEYLDRCRNGPVEGFRFLDPVKWAVHHIDEEPKHNEISNLVLETHSEHRRRHALDGGWRNVAIPTVLSPIIEISAAGEAETFDLSLDEPHNFLADGIVVHNCGKTALPRAICSELGEPLVRFNCDGETRVSNLRGMNVPDAKDGVLTLKFNAGDLAMCMKNGYKVLLDEIDAALPSVRFVLQPVLEEDNRTLHIPETGETIVARNNGFAVFATGNTVGYRAVTRAQYAGTNMMNAAFLDRFGMVIACEYPSREDEYKRVNVNVPDCEGDIVDGICRVAEELRTDDKFTSDFSTRRCIQWARLCAV